MAVHAPCRFFAAFAAELIVKQLHKQHKQKSEPVSYRNQARTFYMVEVTGLEPVTLCRLADDEPSCLLQNHCTNSTNKKSEPVSCRNQVRTFYMVEVTGLEPVTLCRLADDEPSCLLQNHCTNKKIRTCLLSESSSDFLCGGSYRARTCDPLLVRQMLSQLS